jgi:hypothetical protein
LPSIVTISRAMFHPLIVILHVSYLPAISSCRR